MLIPTSTYISPLTDEPLMGEASASDGFAAKNEPTQNQLGDMLRPQLGVCTRAQSKQPEIDAYSLRKAMCHPILRVSLGSGDLNKTAITTLWQQPERNRAKSGSAPCACVGNKRKQTGKIRPIILIYLVVVVLQVLLFFTDGFVYYNVLVEGFFFDIFMMFYIGYSIFLLKEVFQEKFKKEKLKTAAWIIATASAITLIIFFEQIKAKDFLNHIRYGSLHTIEGKLIEHNRSSYSYDEYGLASQKIKSDRVPGGGGWANPSEVNSIDIIDAHDGKRLKLNCSVFRRILCIRELRDSLDIDTRKGDVDNVRVKFFSSSSMELGNLIFEVNANGKQMGFPAFMTLYQKERNINLLICKLFLFLCFCNLTFLFCYVKFNLGGYKYGK